MMPSRRTAALLALIALTGCAASGGSVERLDARSGLTWRAAAKAAVYARTDPRYSRAARDYLYIGPVETNARGLRQYFLWIGVGTTLDRGFLAPAQPLPSRVRLVVGGEPVDLPLLPWAEIVELAASDPYDPPVATGAVLGGRVTRDLLARIGADGIDEVGVGYSDGRYDAYFVWDTGPAWAGFFGADDAR